MLVRARLDARPVSTLLFFNICRPVVLYRVGKCPDKIVLFWLSSMKDAHGLQREAGWWKWSLPGPPEWVCPTERCLFPSHFLLLPAWSADVMAGAPEALFGA